MDNILSVIFTTDFAFSVLRVTTPILFAALGAVVASTAGVANIALEGTMLVAAFVGVMVSSITSSALLGLIAAILSGIAMSGILAFFTLHYKTDVILGGIALNLFASGGTVFFLYLLANDKGTSASIPSEVIPSLQIPILKDIPILGPIFSGHNLLTYVAIIAVIVIYLMLKKTTFGYRLRAVGKNENAADSVGISIIKTKATALLISGALAGFGGAFMSMGYVSWFSRDMTAGRGWIALAAESMGRSTPLGTAATSLLFGTADAFSNAVGSYGFPSELIKIVPYITTILGLLIYAIKDSKRKTENR